jgi:acetyl esterase/lipase
VRIIHILRVGTIIGTLLCALGVAAVAQTDEPVEDDAWPKLSPVHPYGDHYQQAIQVLEPEPRSAPRPAVVLFHGGAFVQGSALQDIAWAQRLAEQGFVTFMADYRLFGQADGANPWPAQLEDAQHAMQWVRANAERFNVDPGRVCAAGHSSGAHLAGLVGTTESSDGSDAGLAGISSRADCVVTVAGHHDLTVPYESDFPQTVLDRLFGGSIEQVPEVWRSASAAHHVDEQTAPFLIIHGNHDREAPVEMARNMAAALAEAGHEYAYAELDADHFAIVDSEATRRLTEAFLAHEMHPES